jgi:hypothetical protein
MINVAPGTAPEDIRQVQLGLEEEGVPGQHRTGQEASAVSLAWEAAALSPLGTGIGIGRDGMALHYNRLNREQPLFFVPASQMEEGESRRLGTNAARLVKGIPFRTKNQEPLCPEGESLSTIVATVIKVLQEYGVWKGESSSHAQKGPGID